MTAILLPWRPRGCHSGHLAPPGSHLVSRRASILGDVIADVIAGVIADVTVMAVELAQGPAAVAEALAEPPVLGGRLLEARAQRPQRPQRLPRPRQLRLRPR